MRRGEWAIAVAALTLSVSSAACADRAGDGRAAASSSGRVGHVSRARADGPKIRIDVATGCPRSIGGAHDVANPPDRAASLLVPDGPTPINGVVCEYVGSPSAGEPLRTRLARQVPLNAADAARLASALRHVSLVPARGDVACPADRSGDNAVIALGYRSGRAVDLWYAWTGCQSIDNGVVLGSRGANKSFYDGFEPVFDGIAPLPR